VRAKDPAEAMRLQAEFVQSQFQAMQAQMREFGGAIQNAAGQAAKGAQGAADAATPRGKKG
jgi:hypothetical protein